jgi:hypothetical protein
LWLLWNAVSDPSQGVDLFRQPIINLYLGVAGLIILAWTWALNLVVWERIGVEYWELLGYKRERMATVQEVYSEVSLCSILFLSNLLLYYKLLRGVAGPLQVLPSYLLPIMVVVYTIYKLLTPWSRRKDVWLLLLQIASAPFGRVRFRELYFADVLTSFNKVIYSAVMAGCYLSNVRTRPPCALHAVLCSRPRALERAPSSSGWVNDDWCCACPLGPHAGLSGGPHRQRDFAALLRNVPFLWTELGCAEVHST